MHKHLENSLEWFRVTFPVVLVTAIMLTVLRDAVVNSIYSTPNPELVYMIFGAFFFSVILCWMTLYSYKKEQSVLTRWKSLPAEDRPEFIASLKRTPDLLPLFDLLDPKQKTTAQNIQSSADAELVDLEKRLSSRLALPTFLGGALIGLGLIGTFIGLLGTLSELSSLFAVLAASPGNEEMSQAEMFQNMIQSLQGPMSAMGTAFVTSLYGLVGSLIVGLVIMNVRKSGATLINQAKRAVRNQATDETSDLASTMQIEMEQAKAEAARWETLFQETRNQRDTISKILPVLHQEQRSLLEAVADLAVVQLERHSSETQALNTIATGSEEVLRAHMAFASINSKVEEIRRDLTTVAKVARHLDVAFIENNQIDDFVREIKEKAAMASEEWLENRSDIRRVRNLMEHDQERARERDDSDRIAQQQIIDVMLQLEAVLKSNLMETRSGSLQSTAEQRELVQALRSCTQGLHELIARMKLGGNQTELPNV